MSGRNYPNWTLIETTREPREVFQTEHLHNLKEKRGRFSKLNTYTSYKKTAGSFPNWTLIEHFGNFHCNRPLHVALNGWHEIQQLIANVSFGQCSNQTEFGFAYIFLLIWYVSNEHFSQHFFNLSINFNGWQENYEESIRQQREFSKLKPYRAYKWAVGIIQTESLQGI